ncbi:MAG: hypothetical protein ACI89W_001217 [Gammaproteobacteria bacterium]|jgi:hypothetical protein
MKKIIKLITMLGVFSGVAFLVYIAGEFALSGSPIVALLPVAVILGLIVLYVRLNDKQD